MKETEELLSNSGITPTPVRKLVLKCISESQVPLSLSDLEMKLVSVDKSSISRSLSIFKEHHLLHSFSDGSGSVKYELSNVHRHDEANGLHVHFRCERCGMTKCLTSVKIPEVILPKGYVAHESNYVITGICEGCNR